MGAITADELRAALRSWEELRLLLLARPPNRGRDKAARKGGSLLSLLGFSPRGTAAQSQPAAPPPAPLGGAGRQPGRHVGSRTEAGPSSSSRDQRAAATAPPAESAEYRLESVTARTMSASEFF